MLNAKLLDKMVSERLEPFTADIVDDPKALEQFKMAKAALARSTYFALMVISSAVAGAEALAFNAFLEGVACGMEMAKQESPNTANLEIAELQRMFNRPLPEA